MSLNFFSDILFPPSCLGCFRELETGVVCDPCESGASLFKTLFCGACGARLPEQKKICHLDSPYILGTAVHYDDRVVQNLVRGLKFHGVKDAARPLSRFLIKYINSLSMNLQNFSVVPIPLSHKRHRGRGFNQSQLIAKYFAEYFRFPLEENLLLRTIHKKPQSETNDIFERRENIHGCFSLADSLTAGGSNFRGNKNIILVDDVTTSGTTFLEAAKMLKSGGAKRILALAVAQA